ncbi:MAG: zinc ABC transporter substrate-binding protein [Halobacteriota archaeon]
MVKRRGVLVVALLALFCVIAVSVTYIHLTQQSGRVAGEKGIGVVVTILPQADFVYKVADDKVRVTVMVPSGASPHTYEPIPAQLRAVSKAKIYFKVGSGVDFERVWMGKILAANPDIQVVNCSTGITIIGNDPHIWNSPANAKIMVRNICNGLIERDHENATYYMANRDKYLQELDKLNSYIHDRLDRFTKKRVFMIYHPAFGYYAKEYNLTQIAIEREGKSPSPKVIQDCIDKAREYNLSYIYAAPQFVTEGVRVIAHAIGGQMDSMDPLPSDYVANMRSITDSIAGELEH